MTTALLIAALFMGFFGSPHCLGMCGGLVTAFSLSMKDVSPAKRRALVFTYHFGRLSSYALLGLLAGFIAEGLAPYGVLSRAPESALQIAVFSGMPVVFTGRGNAGGLTPTFYHSHSPAIAGNNLTSTKARMLLTACLLKFGSLPPAQDPRNPTAAEHAAVMTAIAKYQTIFDTH